MVSLPAAGVKSLGETLGHQGWNSAKVVEAFDTHVTRKFAHRDPEPREKVVEDTATNKIDVLDLDIKPLIATHGKHLIDKITDYAGPLDIHRIYISIVEKE